MFVTFLLLLAFLFLPLNADASTHAALTHKATPIVRHCATEHKFDLRADKIYVGLRSVSTSDRHLLGRWEKCATSTVKNREKVYASRDRGAWLSRQAEPMSYLAMTLHGWDATQVYYEWLVLGKESGSSSGHLDMTATNGDCWGSGQLMGPSAAAAYARYGGNYYTVVGQETADLNYIVEHGYGTPEAAWEHELEFNWY